MTHPADLYTVDLSEAAFRTSSYTSNNGNCVEVAELPSLAAVRDSKNREIPALRVSPAAWASFVTAVATGTLTP